MSSIEPPQKRCSITTGCTQAEEVLVPAAICVRCGDKGPAGPGPVYSLLSPRLQGGLSGCALCLAAAVVAADSEVRAAGRRHSHPGAARAASALCCASGCCSGGGGVEAPPLYELPGT
jgi:hypothetical protein